MLTSLWLWLPLLLWCDRCFVIARNVSVKTRSWPKIGWSLQQCAKSQPKTIQTVIATRNAVGAVTPDGGQGRLTDCWI